jgi:regulator of RNase E activity RraA
MRVAGAVQPARHHGSVDVFLEAIARAEPGAVLAIDNGGRLDEGCIGDLTTLEAKAAGLAGLVVFGAHRDSAELRQIGWPVFSYGCTPSGPVRHDPRAPDALQVARFGACEVSAADAVFADDDGALFVARARLEEVLAAAEAIARTERRQAESVRAGESLRAQLRFDEYLARRAREPAFTFRQHLRAVGGAIEE